MEQRNEEAKEHGVPGEDILVFARGLVGSYGETAYYYAVGMAEALADVGDRSGEAVWSDVALRIRTLGLNDQAS